MIGIWSICRSPMVGDSSVETTATQHCSHNLTRLFRTSAWRRYPNESHPTHHNCCITQVNWPRTYAICPFAPSCPFHLQHVHTLSYTFPFFNPSGKDCLSSGSTHLRSQPWLPHAAVACKVPEPPWVQELEPEENPENPHSKWRPCQEIYGGKKQVQVQVYNTITTGMNISVDTTKNGMRCKCNNHWGLSNIC